METVKRITNGIVKIYLSKSKILKWAWMLQQIVLAGKAQRNVET